MIARSAWRALLAGVLTICFGQTTVVAGSSRLPPALESMFGGPFSLTDHTGAARTDEDFRGRFMLITFGYVSCPSICPANLTYMADALDRLGEEASRIVPVFVSIDPGRDDRGALRDFVAHFGERFVGLTGDEQQVREIAKAYRVHRRKVMVEQAEPQDYLVDHGSVIYLMGPEGGFRTLFPHGTTGSVMAGRIASYLTD